MLKFAVGDIHGCLHLLRELVDQCVNYATTRDQEFQFIFLGDYIDRGPDSRGVIDYLISLRDHPNTICLCGNHDIWMVKTFDQEDNWGGWINWGGRETLESYGDDLETRQAHMEWIRGLPLMWEDDLRFYVHAGVQPGIPLAEQFMPETLLWMREPFLSSHYDFGKLIVHGHTPVDKVEVKPNRLGLDTGAVFGGRLTAAVFNDEQREPIEYLSVGDGRVLWRHG